MLSLRFNELQLTSPNEAFNNAISRESRVDSPPGNPKNFLATIWLATLSVHVWNHVIENVGPNHLELLFHHLNLVIRQIVAQLLVEQPRLWSRAVWVGLGANLCGLYFIKIFS